MIKEMISVTEMINEIKLSRARFYQLLKQGVFPPPIYDIRTKRPMYDINLQKACIQVKQSGRGVNGQYMLFYTTNGNRGISKAPKKTMKVNLNFFCQLAF